MSFEVGAGVILVGAGDKRDSDHICYSHSVSKPLLRKFF